MSERRTAVEGRSGSGDEYDPPAVRAVLTAAMLERDIVYAGIDSGCVDCSSTLTDQPA